MRLYPELSPSRARTIASDVAVVLAIAVLAWLGFEVHDAVLELTPVTDGVQSAGSAVEGALSDAGDRVSGAPLVGDDVGDALRDAGRGTGGEAVAAGRAGEEGIRDLARLLGWLTFLVPAALLLSRAVPPRLRQVRRLTAASRVVDGADRALLAQRAAFGLPYARLLRHTPDPLGDLAANRLDRLVAAAREDAGLHPEPQEGLTPFMKRV